ncbi:MAG: DsrE family protein [Gammaproteobacteria bacterium]|nr:DsrE family protein [Gammaproteobacteria bacterium]
MKTLFILNGAPYGEERTYNALRLANSLAKRDGAEVRLFLMGDAVGTAKRGQQVAEGFYNLQLMLDRLGHSDDNRIGVCGTCMDARGIHDNELAEVTHRGTLEELTEWCEWADKVLTY